jgi:hypothetical protein
MRRGLKALVAVAVLLGAALVTLPWWLGAALRPAGQAWGLQIGGYERVGYARFRLTDVTYAGHGVVVSAARIETDTPLLWSWGKYRGTAQRRPSITGRSSSRSSR